jgi:hypothetical protein
MPRDWRDGGEDRETLVSRAGLSDREEEEGEGSIQQQSRPAHQDSVYKYETNTIVQCCGSGSMFFCFGLPGSGFVSQSPGSGFFFRQAKIVRKP